MRQVELLIIGGGSAGMAAAVGAYRQGCRDMLILERSEGLGGILRQCIHNGFGLHHFGEDLTGVEFARRYTQKISSLGIPYELRSFVLSLSRDLTATVVSPERGIYDVRARAVLLAMGCRERTRNQLLIPGMRGAGILTAGTAQRYLNLEGYLPGKRIVILGSGDIGLIMARQFALERAKVEAVLEIMPYSSGLARNISQCLHDFDIPLYYRTTVTDIFGGHDRLQAVAISEVDELRRPIPGTERKIACDTLMVSAGLIPENELSADAGVELCAFTRGAVVTDDYQTSVPGIFSCGNALHVHDLVDFVAEEGGTAGRNAALYLQDRLPEAGKDWVPVQNGPGVNGTVPQKIGRKGADSEIRLLFRPQRPYRNVHVRVDCDGKTILRQKRMALAPGEMCEVKVGRALVSGCRDGILVCVEE